MRRKWPVVLLVVILLLAGVVFIGPRFLNKFQKDGSLRLAGLKAPVRVLRDEKGMASIYAKNLEDALMAQGFVTAQDRLFQMELTRLFSSGRISELAGDAGKKIDIRMRTIGFSRQAKKHARILSSETRLFFQKYADGVNAYIKGRAKTHHLEFKLAGIEPGPWTIEDSLTIMYYMGWDSAGNIDAEIISQMLVDKLGPDKAGEIFPVNVNPDDSALPLVQTVLGGTDLGLLGPAMDEPLLAFLEQGTLQVGSNNWAAGPKISTGGKPIVANDPHLDSRILPGPWYPCGLILPDRRFVGVMIPGMPGMGVGRSSDFAIALTNAYGDAQDLFIETVDPSNPDRYMEGNESLPFTMIEETLKIKDKEAPGGFKKEKINIRFTKRGPVVSGVLSSLKAKKVMTLRWTAFESMEPLVGIERLLHARTVEEIHEGLKNVNWIMLNFVFADTKGDIGWHVSSRLPIRMEGDGSLPIAVKDGRDNWTGWIPWDEMPHVTNPERGWVGTCNHLVVKRDYPYCFSSEVSASYRYERLTQLLDTPVKKSADDHWQYQLDTLNLMAMRIGPLMAKALLAHEDTREMGTILTRWDHRDDTDKVGPTIFQAVYKRFAWLVFKDELGKELAETMLNHWTYWQERLQKMVLEGASPWFDNIETADIKETRDVLFHQAALDAAGELKDRLGDDMKKWTWGEVHRMEFVSPIRREGFGKGLAGGGSHPFPGSVETLCRGMYDFNNPYDVTIPASLRMVADLSDEDKILAILPGGVSGRMFDPHTTDQIKAFVSGEKMYWWFSDKAIEKHARNELVLTQ